MKFAELLDYTGIEPGEAQCIALDKFKILLEESKFSKFHENAKYAIYVATYSRYDMVLLDEVNANHENWKEKELCAVNYDEITRESEIGQILGTLPAFVVYNERKIEASQGLSLVRQKLVELGYL